MNASDLPKEIQRLVSPTDAASIEDGGDGGTGHLALSRWRISASQAEIADHLDGIASMFKIPSLPFSVLKEASNRIRSGKVRAKYSRKSMLRLVKGNA